MLPHADLKQINFHQAVRPDKAKNLKYRYLSPGPSNDHRSWWGSLINLLKVKNLCVHQLCEPRGKGIYLVLLHRFSGVKSWPSHCPEWSFELTQESLLHNCCQFNVVFFAVGYIRPGVYPCMQNIPLSCESSAFLWNLLHTTLHQVTKPDPANTPKFEAQEQFKYWLSTNGSVARRTKQNFAGNGWGSDQFLLH